MHHAPMVNVANPTAFQRLQLQNKAAVTADCARRTGAFRHEVGM